MSRFRRALMISAGLTVLLVGLVGFAHTRAGRPLLAAIGWVPGSGRACPLGYDRPADPAARERVQRNLSAHLRGEHPAAERPALAFELERSRQIDVAAYMAARGIACRPGVGMADLVCDDVPASALGAGAGAETKRNLWFTFGEGHRLIALVAVSKAAQAAPISDAYRVRTEAITKQMGHPSNVTGEATPAFLEAGALHQASAEFRFSNYYASTRATNLGKSGYLLTEEYRSLVD